MNDPDIEQIKKDWILLHGSDLLKASLLAGDSVDLQYAKERVQLDYPGFFLPTYMSISKTDSPPAYCLQACTEVTDSYCSHRCYGGEEYYLTIDNYLGKHTIVKEIIVPVEIAENEFSLDFEDWHSELNNYESEKKDWTFSYGSDLLQRSYIDSYDSSPDRFLKICCFVIVSLLFIGHMGHSAPIFILALVLGIISIIICRIYATTTYRDALKEWNDTYECQRCEETFLLE